MKIKDHILNLWKNPQCTKFITLHTKQQRKPYIEGRKTESKSLDMTWQEGLIKMNHVILSCIKVNVTIGSRLTRSKFVNPLVQLKYSASYMRSVGVVFKHIAQCSLV